jgi:cell division septation protein DedD
MGERKDLRDLLRDTDFTQKRIIDDLANSGIESYSEKDTGEKIRRAEGGDFIRNFFVGVLLIGIVIGSFWASFLIGKKLLVPPVKNLPTYELPVPKTVTKSEIESAIPANEDETPIPEHEIKAIDKKEGLPKPVLSAKKIAAGRAMKNSESKAVVGTVSANTATIVAKPQTVAKVAETTTAPAMGTKTLAGRHYKAIAGTYKTLSDAKIVISYLKKNGISSFAKKTKTGLYRVQAGAFESKAKAAPMLAKLKAKGLHPVLRQE